MRFARVLAVAVALLVIRAGVSARADRITSATVLAVEHWSSAVKAHEPGRADAAVQFVADMSLQRRQEFVPGLKLFLTTLTGTLAGPGSAEEKAIADLGSSDRQTVGVNTFLERAAVLHADVAEYGGSVAGKSDPGSGRDDRTASDLLVSRPLVLAKDGERVGTAETNWNWVLARGLLDRIAPRPAESRFVAQWYHATTAYLLSQAQFGEADGQLQHASALLPDDPFVLFDRACLSEILGLRASQQTLNDEVRTTPQHSVRGAVMLGLRQDVAPPTINIPVAHVADDLATRLFRRTLEVNPNFVEARVRLARLLEEDGRPEEATAQLTQVFAAQPSRADGVVAFYAHLFATRADEFQGRLPSAAEHSRAALALYPRAQSALLMSSHVALRAGNAVDVEASLQRLADASTGDGGNDPWRVYGRGPGRDAPALMSELWVAVGKDGGAPTVK